MTAPSTLPDPGSHPGLRLMEATAAVLRGERAPPRPADVLGGAFLEGETPVPLSDGAADQVLARIAGLEAIDARGREAARRASRGLTEMLDLPDPLREAVFEAMATGRKWRFLGFGIRGLKLAVGGEGETELLRIEPGHGVAPHDHGGEEYTLVVTGAFHDGHERFGPGDVNIARPGFVHAPLAEKDEVCFALGVSLGGGARFEGAFGVFQRLSGL
jgi:putative transcriptional regulator